MALPEVIVRGSSQDLQSHWIPLSLATDAAWVAQFTQQNFGAAAPPAVGPVAAPAPAANQPNIAHDPLLLDPKVAAPTAATPAPKPAPLPEVVVRAPAARAYDSLLRPIYHIPYLARSAMRGLVGGQGAGVVFGSILMDQWSNLLSRMLSPAKSAESQRGRPAPSTSASPKAGSAARSAPGEQLLPEVLVRASPRPSPQLSTSPRLSEASRFALQNATGQRTPTLEQLYRQLGISTRPQPRLRTRPQPSARAASELALSRKALDLLRQVVRDPPMRLAVPRGPLDLTMTPLPAPSPAPRPSPRPSPLPGPQVNPVPQLDLAPMPQTRLAPQQDPKCKCKEPKKRQPRKPRSICRQGTYTQTANRIIYTPRKEGPCQSSNEKWSSLQVRRKTTSSPALPSNLRAAVSLFRSLS